MSARGLIPHTSDFVDVLVVRNLPTPGGRCLVGYPLRRTRKGNGMVNVFMNNLPKGAQVKPGMRVRAASVAGSVRMNLAEIYVPPETDEQGNRKRRTRQMGAYAVRGEVGAMTAAL